MPLLLLALPLALLLYYELILAEGAHLGPRVVTALYDLVAWRYDRIKSFDLAVENDTLGWPLAVALAPVARARVLDVACGTGRVARALLRQPIFDGAVVNVDLAWRMLRQGRRAAAESAGAAERQAWARAAAAPLPFAAASFDAVTCLEALEFVPDAGAVLAECARVLRPGGVLLVSNRVGRLAWLLVGKTASPAAFEQRLLRLGLTRVRTEKWQEEYDLVWSVKE